MTVSKQREERDLGDDVPVRSVRRAGCLRCGTAHRLSQQTEARQGETTAQRRGVTTHSLLQRQTLLDDDVSSGGSVSSYNASAMTQWVPRDRVIYISYAGTIERCNLSTTENCFSCPANTNHIAEGVDSRHG